MEEKITVLLADGDRTQRLALRGILETAGTFRIVGEASGGRQVLALVRELRPRIVITELWLPEIDGLSLLRHFRQMDAPPWTIILSAFTADHILAEASRRGAFYCMAKPVDAVSLVEQMLLSTRIPQQSLSPITRALHELTTPHASQGFRFLEVSIALVIEDPDLLNAVTKELYPAVAKECHSTTHSVESDMRRTIAYIWENCEAEVLRHYFPRATRRPTNSAFIATLADQLRPIVKI